MFQLEQYEKDKHYETLSSWWKGHGWEPVAAVFLPSMGFIAYHAGNPIAAGFCYLDTTTPIGTLEWLVTDPNGYPKLCLQALNVIVDMITRTTRELGYTALFTSTRRDGLVRILARRGFVKTDKDMIHLVMLLDPKAQEMADRQGLADPIAREPTLLESSL